MAGIVKATGGRISSVRNAVMLADLHLDRRTLGLCVSGRAGTGAILALQAGLARWFVRRRAWRDG